MSAVDGQRDDIQGLRALAVLAVIVFHVNHNWLPGGFIGVDVFFVISGYLITRIVLEKKAQGTFSFMSFYASRVRRIAPAYIFLLAMIAAIMAVLLIPRDFDSFYESLKSAAYFNSNSYFNKSNDYFAPASHELPLLHTWSLAVEMQFYLFLPALIVLTPTRFIKFMIAAIAAALLIYSEFLLFKGEKQSVYFSLLARVPEFLVGSLLAATKVDKGAGGFNSLKAWVGVALIAFSFLFISEASAFPGVLSLAPSIGTALLISARGSMINRWLASRIMILVGGMSYSLYLWHWPILAGLRYYLEVYELPLGALAIFAILTLAMSFCSYYCIESPLRHSAGRKGSLKRVALFAVAVTTVLAAKAVNPVMVTPLAVELTRYAAPETICHSQIVGECIRGDHQASKEILLLGDSHAAQLNYFADVVGESLHARIRVITASNCVPIEGFDKERIPEYSRVDCANQTLAVRKYLESADAILLAGMWQYHSSSEQFMIALEKFVSEVSSRDQPLIVLAQIPMLTSNVQRMHRFNELGGSRVAHIEKTWAPSNLRVKTLVSRYPNVAFFDPTSLALFATPPIADGRLIYHDNHHLNEVGAKAYGMAARDLLARELSQVQEGASERKLARLQRSAPN
ncbi:acyltransferase family protein [Pseudomonas sp. NPDC089530]|uniref:acyltransferase family protein n=1 Tax=Pseudomonas sp. NPDC089530 TaxID=3390651 RepID=UPI003CFEC5A1